MRRTAWPPRALGRAIALLALASLVVSGSARADEPVPLEVPAGPFHVGDPVSVIARVALEPGEQLVQPDLGDSLGKLGVREVQAVPPPPSGDEQRATLRVTLQAFQTGTVEIPPIPFQVRDPKGKVRESTTAAAKLEVSSVIPASDEQRAPAELAGPAEMSLDKRKLAILVAMVSALLALGALLGWWLFRRLSRRKPRPEAPPLPADQQALRELERLLASPWLEKGDLRRFHIELSAILKRYLEGRFGFPALERTTTEVERDLRRLAIDTTAQQPTVRVLRDCDAVKFANQRTTADEGRERAFLVRGVIERTRLSEQVSSAGH